MLTLQRSRRQAAAGASAMPGSVYRIEPPINPTKWHYIAIGRPPPFLRFIIVFYLSLLSVFPYGRQLQGTHVFTFAKNSYVGTTFSI